MTDSLAIDLHNVSKVYRGRIHALQGVDMRVRRGEVFGLLGPNGAGKSTLVKIMMSVARPTRAQGTILDAPVGDKATLARIGYLPESHRFPRYLTGRQVVEFFAALSKVDRLTRKRRAAELLATVGMADHADRKISTYSKGMMQRTGLAQALVADPDLVVLDEPTDGVDPVGRREIRDVIAALRTAGKTIFINSHLLGELELICDRVAILVNGRIARHGTMNELSIAKQRFEIEVASNGEDTSMTRSHLVQCLAPYTIFAGSPLTCGEPSRTAPSRCVRGTLRAGQWIELEGLLLRIGTAEASDVQPLLDALRGSGLIIRRVQLMRPSLEDLFIEAVSRRGPESADSAVPAFHVLPTKTLPV